MRSRSLFLVLAALAVALLVLLLRPRSEAESLAAAGDADRAAAPAAGALADTADAPQRRASTPKEEAAEAEAGAPEGAASGHAAAAEPVVPETLLVVEAGTGNPIPDAEVAFLPADADGYFRYEDVLDRALIDHFLESSATERRARADATGRVAYPRSRDRFVIVGRSPGRVGVLLDFFGGRTELVQALQEVPDPLVLVGRVLGPDRAPLPVERIRGEITYRGPRGGMTRRGLFLELGLDGSFREEVTDLPDEEDRVTVSFRHETDEELLVAEVELPGPVTSGEYSLGDVVLQPPDPGDVFVAGTLVRADGSPDQGWIMVEAQGERGRWRRTGLMEYVRDGSFSFRGSPEEPGPYRVTAERGAFRVSQPFQPGDRDVELRLPAVGAIAMQVLGLDMGSWGLLHIDLVRDGKPVPFGSGWRGGPEGQVWRLTGLAGGSYDLVVRSEATGEELWRRDGLVVAGDDPLPVVVDLRDRLREAVGDVLGAGGLRLREVFALPADAGPGARPAELGPAPARADPSRKLAPGSVSPATQVLAGQGLGDEFQPGLGRAESPLQATDPQGVATDLTHFPGPVSGPARR